MSSRHVLEDYIAIEVYREGGLEDGLKDELKDGLEDGLKDELKDGLKDVLEDELSILPLHNLGNFHWKCFS